jgi:hypothetical protein
MSHKVRHECVVSQILFECVIDVRNHGSISIDQLIECFLPEVYMEGGVGEKVEFELVKGGYYW